VKAYGEWLASSHVPKLLIMSDPGGILAGKDLEFARSWPAQKEVTCRGIHFIQEDSPHEIGRAVAEWMTTLR